MNTERDFIYNQNDIPKRKWRYGFRPSASTGCGWVAAYNALKIMGYYMPPEKLIRSYQRQLPIFNGPFGTFILEPALFFRKKGFPVKLSTNRRQFDRIAREADACIMFYYWRRKFKFGAHFVCLNYQDGKYIGYNTFKNSKGPDNYGISLESFLRKQAYFFPVLIGIKNKMNK